MGINQRVSLRKFTDDIRRWVVEDRSDEWIASALGTSPSSVQSFRSRNGIYRRSDDFDAARPEGLLFLRRGARARRSRHLVRPEIGKDPRWHKRWSSTERVELRLTPTRIVFLRREVTRGSAATR